MPACSNAAAAASVVGDGADVTGMDGLKTSKDPKRRVRKATERRKTGLRGRCFARSAVASTSATAPSPGEQNMYWVSGWLTILEARTSSSLSGLRRQAFGLRDPFSNALDATLASVDSLIPCSAMYRWIFMAKNCVVSISPVSPYQEPMPHSSGSGLNAPGGCLSKPTTSAISAEPATSIACAVVRAEPPVAQPFLTLMNGTPVSPSTETVVSALPAASEPPAATSTSSQPIPASSNAARAAIAAISRPETPG